MNMCLWASEKSNIIVNYDQYYLGMKYKVYRKVSYCGLIRFEYVNGFNTLGEAVTYAKRMNDTIVER